MSEKEQQSLELLAHRMESVETTVKELAVVVRGNGVNYGNDLRAKVNSIEASMHTRRMGCAEVISIISALASLAAIATFLLTHFSKGG